MPYIKPENRLHINHYIENLVPYINSKGELNYTICEIVGQLILGSKISYTEISEWIDGVHDAEKELTRRILNSYEEIKITENGDVPSFKNILTILKE